MVTKSHYEKGLYAELPGIAAAFPELDAKFADFGQHLQKSARKNENFAAKFAEAVNAGDSPTRKEPVDCESIGGGIARFKEFSVISCQ